VVGFGMGACKVECVESRVLTLGVATRSKSVISQHTTEVSDSSVVCCQLAHLYEDRLLSQTLITPQSWLWD
jgi:hypothetical protein